MELQVIHEDLQEIFNSDFLVRFESVFVSILDELLGVWSFDIVYQPPSDFLHDLHDLLLESLSFRDGLSLLLFIVLFARLILLFEQFGHVLGQALDLFLKVLDFRVDNVQGFLIVVSVFDLNLD